MAEAATVSQDNERLEETEGVVADKKTTKQGVERREVTEEEEALPASKEDGEALYSNTDIETDGKSRKGKNTAVKKGEKKKRKWDKWINIREEIVTKLILDEEVIDSEIDSDIEIMRNAKDGWKCNQGISSWKCRRRFFNLCFR